MNRARGGRGRPRSLTLRAPRRPHVRCAFPADGRGLNDAGGVSPRGRLSCPALLTGTRHGKRAGASVWQGSFTNKSRCQAALCCAAGHPLLQGRHARLLVDRRGQADAEPATPASMDTPPWVTEFSGGGACLGAGPVAPPRRGTLRSSRRPAPCRHVIWAESWHRQ